MLPSQLPKQQLSDRRGRTESIEHQFVVASTARFQANHIDQPSLNDLILRGSTTGSSHVVPTTTLPSFREIDQFGSGLLNLMSILDDALRVCMESVDQESDGPQSNDSLHSLNQ